MGYVHCFHQSSSSFVLSLSVRVCARTCASSPYGKNPSSVQKFSEKHCVLCLISVLEVVKKYVTSCLKERFLQNSIFHKKDKSVRPL